MPLKEKSREFTKKYWEEKCPGAEVLDYACGNGEDTRTWLN